MKILKAAGIVAIIAAHVLLVAWAIWFKWTSLWWFWGN
jgi:hypothetical protein